MNQGKAKLNISVACALLGVTTGAANASTYTVTLTQVTTGGVTNVDANGSGSIDNTGLKFLGISIPGPREVYPAIGDTGTGAIPVTIDGYTGLTGPTNFGPGGRTIASTGTGDWVEVLGSQANLYVPVDYVSGNPLSGSATYDNTTLAMLGATPGAYIWTWGTGADASSFFLDVAAPITTPTPATPLPTTLPLFATGLGALGLLGWRRKRKVRVSLLGAA